MVVAVPRTNVEDIIKSFEKQDQYSHIANTFDLLADVVFLHQLEKALSEYLALKRS